VESVVIKAVYVDDKDLRKQVKKVLRQAGREVSRAAARLVEDTVGAGRQYGSHIASAPGQAPAELSGNLASSFSVASGRGLSVTVTDGAHYALFLEEGSVGGGAPPGVKFSKGDKGKRNTKTKDGDIIAATNRKQDPRPFLTVALENMEDDLRRRVVEAIEQNVNLKEVK
jgi:HK97 gp10 family phage protein